MTETRAAERKKYIDDFLMEQEFRVLADIRLKGGFELNEQGKIIKSSDNIPRSYLGYYRGYRTNPESGNYLKFLLVNGVCSEIYKDKIETITAFNVDEIYFN